MTKDFDKFSDNYSDILNSNLEKYSEYGSEYYQEYKVKLIAESGIKPLKILDFGCGVGLGTKFLKKYFPNAEIIGIDVSEDCILEAKKIPDIEFLTYDGKNLPFNENEFDLIYSSCVFHHIPKLEHKQLFLQLNFCLKPDGRIFIFEHNPLNPLTRKVVRECVFDEKAELVFPKEFKKIMQCKINYTLFVPRLKFLEKTFFIEKYLKFLPLGAQYFAKFCKQK